MDPSHGTLESRWRKRYEEEEHTETKTKTRAATLPTWQQLAELWLETRHPGRPAVYFSAPFFWPASAYSTITRYLPEELLGTLTSAEFVVLECDDVDEARRIMEETRGTGIYVMVWDGERIVTHH